MEQKTWAKIPLFDDYWIDFKKNVMRRWYQPVKRSEYLEPYQGVACYSTALWSPEQDCYLMWYEYLVDPNDDEARYVALARSEDGVSWRPWDVCEHPDEGKRIFKNTVYLGNPGVHGCFVMRDEREKNAELRYKMCGGNHAARYRELGIQNSPVYISASPDGIHWKEMEGTMVHPNTSDTVNCLYYNPVTEEYNAIVRAGYVDRRICRTTSKDLKSWTLPRVILHPGADYNDDAYATQLYGLSARWLDGYFVGFLWRYFTSCCDFDYSRMKGFQDTELVYSYDGEHWMRTSQKAIVERPQAPEYGFSSLTFNCFFENRQKDRLWMLASGERTMHCATAEHEARYGADSRPTSAVLTYEIRKDGFCGLEANTTDGLIVTKTFELVEPELTYNLCAEFGRVRFAFYDHQGKPYEGFDFEDSIPFSGESLAHRPTFHHHDLAELRGKRVRFAVKLDGATLYCIAGAFRPWIRFPQVSLNNAVHTTYPG